MNNEEEAKKLLKKMRTVLSQLTADRDLLNVALRHVRSTIYRIEKQREILKYMKERGEEYPLSQDAVRLIHDATSYFVELSQRLVKPLSAAKPVSKKRDKRQRKKSRGPKKYGVHWMALRVLETAFCKSRTSASIAVVLQDSFGKDWAQKKIHGFLKGGKKGEPIERALINDIGAKQSLLFKLLSRAYEHLLRYEADLEAGGEILARPEVIGLYKTIRTKHNLNYVENKLVQWGVEIEERE